MPARNTGGRVTAMQGSCLCGGVRFELTGEFQGVVHCHCASCKKLSGGVGTTSGLIATGEIRILEGEELLRTFHPADGKAKTFCANPSAWTTSNVCARRGTPASSKPPSGPDVTSTGSQPLQSWCTNRIRASGTGTLVSAARTRPCSVVTSDSEIVSSGRRW